MACHVRGQLAASFACTCFFKKCCCVPKMAFYDAADWVGEVEKLEKVVKATQEELANAKRREKSWEREAGELRKEWDRARRQIALLEREKGQCEEEFSCLKDQYDELVQLKEREAVKMKCEIEQCRRELVDKKKQCKWLEGGLKETEEKVKMLEMESERQREIVEEYERKVREDQERKKIRERIEYEEEIRAEIVAKKKKLN